MILFFEWINVNRFGFSACGEGDVLAVGNGYGKTIGSHYLDILYCPVFGIFDCSCGLCMNNDVFQIKIFDHRNITSFNMKGSFCVVDFNIGKVNMIKMWYAQFRWFNFLQHFLPVNRQFFSFEFFR